MSQVHTQQAPAPPRPAPDGHRAAPHSETKNGFKTSEFYVMLIFVAGVLIAAFAQNDDGFTRDEGFWYATIAVAVYIGSRGLAKLGVRDSGSNDRY